VIITPDMLEATYELLRVTLPFRRWKLPHPDDLGFRVSGARDRHAHYRNHKGVKEICVSQFHAKGLEKLQQDVAHEMVHLRLDEVGDSRVNHGPKFVRLAKIVCWRHKWDLQAFISG
jgi:hypothetical protein